MVLQDYGAALPAEPKRSRSVMMVGGIAVAAISVLALVLVVSTSGSSAPQALLQENLHDSLMSASADESADDSSDQDMSSDDSSGASSQSLSQDANFYGHWGHDSWGHHHAKSKTNSWVSQLQAMQVTEKARRKKEDASFFSGVKDAFGAKAAAGMMGAFNGKGKVKGVVSHFKLDEKKLAAKNAELQHSGKMPASTKQLVESAKAEAKAKMMHKKLGSAQAAILATANAKSEGKEKEGVVAAALTVAKQMAQHTDPVAKDAVPAAAAAVVAAPKVVAKKVVAPKKVNLRHLGVIQDGLKIQKLSREARVAHGAKKLALKARVMSLEQNIKSSFKLIDNFGNRASTKFARENAKKPTGGGH